MFGVPLEESNIMIVSTTFVPFACAVLMNPGTGPLGSFHVVRAESLLKSPVQATCTPKYATVESNAKFHDGYPIVGSPRLLANAKPKTSRNRRGLVGASGIWAEFATVDPT